MADDGFKSPEDNVFTFKNVNFTVDGTRFPVSRLVLAAFDNAPPIIRVSVATVKYDAQLQIVNLSASLDNHDYYQRYCGTTGTKVHLSFDVETKAGNQSVTLDKWVLMPSGFDPVSVGNMISATFMLAHPAMLADTNTLSVYNVSKVMEAPTISGDNPYACFMDALGKFSDKLQGLKSSSDSTKQPPASLNQQQLWAVNKLLADAAAESIKALKDNTKWYGPNKLPYAGTWTNCTKLPATLWNYVQGFNNTPYDVFNNFLGAFMLTATGTFDDAPLSVYPFVPWGNSVGYIYDSQIERISVPTGDRSIIGTVVTAGLGVSKEFGYCPPGAYGKPGVAGVGGMPTHLFAYGWYLEFVGKLIGKIQEISAPPWMLMVAQLLLKDVETPYEEGEINNPDNLKTSEDPEAVNDEMVNDADFVNTVMAYAEDALFTVFGINQAVTMTTRLMISSTQFKAFGSDKLRPGVVISVRSVENDANLLYFYVNRVEHTIDVSGGQAFTTLTGAFYRTPSGVLDSSGNVLGEIGPDTVKNGKPLNMYSDFKVQ